MKKLMTLALGALISFNASAGLVVIGSPDLPSSLSAKEAKKAYLGKKVGFNGGNLTVLELEDGNAEKATFHSSVTKKNLSQLHSYWSKKLFTGKGTPPEALANQAQVKARVASSTAMIGYVDESLVDDSVQVLLKL